MENATNSSGVLTNDDLGFIISCLTNFAIAVVFFLIFCIVNSKLPYVYHPRSQAFILEVPRGGFGFGWMSSIWKVFFLLPLVSSLSRNASTHFNSFLVKSFIADFKKNQTVWSDSRRILHHGSHKGPFPIWSVFLEILRKHTLQQFFGQVFHRGSEKHQADSIQNLQTQVQHWF